jgi:hypothetical protein
MYRYRRWNAEAVPNVVVKTSRRRPVMPVILWLLGVPLVVVLLLMVTHVI